MSLFFNPFVFFCFCFAALLALELLYFRIADRYNIIDKPNSRSSHVLPVVRGGGVIFVAAILIGEIATGFTHRFFALGAVLIALVSFIDDVRPQSAMVRFTCHVIAILLLQFETGAFHYGILLMPLIVIVAVGTVNAFNFMDGINGMAGVYGLVNVLTFAYVNEFHVSFISDGVLIAVLSSLIVFLIYNFRVNARCFAGDVGSITLAYFQTFLMVLLIIETANFAWILIFTVYGVDATVTIIHRIVKRENIFKPHRTHLYQYFANELGFCHRSISSFYGFLQLVINVSVIYFFQKSEFVLIGVVISLMVILYLSVRYRVLLAIAITRSLP